MIEIQVDVADLTKVRFGRSALAEVQASLHGLRHPYKHALHGLLADRLPADSGAELDFLMDVFAPDDWVPDSLTCQPSVTDAVDPERQIESIATADDAVVEGDLEYLRTRYPDRWRPVSTQRFRSDLATAVDWYWRRVLSPLWERIESITTADLTYRAGVITRLGVRAAMEDLSPHCAFAVDAIRIFGHRHEGCYVIKGCGIWLIPTVFRWPRLSVSIAYDAPILSYGARGAARLWEDQPEQRPGLDGLLGRTRSMILTALAVPGTTKSLAMRLDLSPPNVSQHLSVLEATGLLASYREGRLVWYQRTELGHLLVSSQRSNGRRQR